MAHSEMFERFLAGVRAPVTFERDVLDQLPGLGALHLLEGEERTEAEDILIAMLPRNDGRVAAALADIGCVRAVPALVEATSESVPPDMRVHAAGALLKLGSDSGRAALAGLLRTHEGDSTDRGSAARLLAEFPDPDKELLLAAAATDPAEGVRSAAANAALAVYGLDSEDVRWGEVLWSIRGRLQSSLTTVRAEAAAELRAVLARWEAGETADELGLAWRASERNKPLRRFTDSLDSGRADFPVEAVMELTGRERIVVENLVLLRLHEDRRAVRAAGSLRVHRAVEPLRELLGSATGHARAEIESVLETLTR
jgi:HEAT repeat protein